MDFLNGEMDSYPYWEKEKPRNCNFFLNVSVGIKNAHGNSILLVKVTQENQKVELPKKRLKQK